MNEWSNGLLGLSSYVSRSFFKIFADQPPVFIISFHLPEIPQLPLKPTTSLPRPNVRTKKYCSLINFGLHHYQPT